MVLIVQRRDRLSKRPNTSCGTVLSAMSTDINLFRPLKAALNAIIDLRGTLAQVRPLFGVFEESVLVGLF
jgi:hypothetical protein